MHIVLQVSPGELIDKLTILEIKLARINDPEKRANVLVELALVRDACARALPPLRELTELQTKLARVNEALWDIEDDLRERERALDFGERFVALARSVYMSNDRRAAIKREINRLLDSAIIEEKLYASYERSPG